MNIQEAVNVVQDFVVKGEDQMSAETAKKLIATAEMVKAAGGGKFDESKHKRASDGKFSSGNGGGSKKKSVKKKPASKSGGDSDKHTSTGLKAKVEDAPKPPKPGVKYPKMKRSSAISALRSMQGYNYGGKSNTKLQKLSEVKERMKGASVDSILETAIRAYMKQGRGMSRASAMQHLKTGSSNKWARGNWN